MLLPVWGLTLVAILSTSGGISTTGAVLLTSGNMAISGNGVPTSDDDYEKAVNFCALAVFAQALKDSSVDPMQHGQKYDEALEKCRVALGALMDH